MYGYGNSFFLVTNSILAKSNAGTPPVNTVAPAITGTAQEGQTLTSSTGTWTGTPTITYTYQWKRNGSNIGSATNSTYTLVTADVGQSIKCTVTATNGVGSANADSNTVIPISAFTGLLDSYPNAAVAYSLRKLRSAYSGNAIRVRRSNDNTEQDIAFSGNDLDTTTMLDFVGYNLWTRSEEFDNALYVKTNINATGTPAYIDVETAPDSTLTGDKIIENTTSGSHLFRRETGTIINGASYNISVYLKQAERTSVEISSQISGTLQTCILDLTNGNVSSNGFANTPVVTAEANGWYRFSVTITSGVTSQLTGLRVSLRNALNQTSYTGDGTSGAYVWGTQLSQTSSVKTYQKTVATAGGNGFVTTWYDQSGNGLNVTNTTANNQPQIVSSGSVLMQNSKPTMLFDGSNDSLFRANTNIFRNKNYGVIFTANRFIATPVTNSRAILYVSNSLGGTRYSNGKTTSSNYNLAARRLDGDSAQVIATTTTYTNTNLYLTTGIVDWGNTDAYLYVNNNLQVSNTNFLTAGNTDNTQSYISISSAEGTAFANAHISEVVIYESSQDVNGINTNLNTFYSAY